MNRLKLFDLLILATILALGAGLAVGAPQADVPQVPDVVIEDVPETTNLVNFAPAVITTPNEFTPVNVNDGDLVMPSPTQSVTWATRLDKTTLALNHYFEETTENRHFHFGKDEKRAKRNNQIPRAVANYPRA